MLRKDNKTLESTLASEKKNHELRLREIIEEAELQLNAEIEQTKDKVITHQLLKLLY